MGRWILRRFVQFVLPYAKEDFISEQQQHVEDGGFIFHFSANKN